MAGVADPRPQASAGQPLPLACFTVLELTAARAGPAAGRHLADWGATVIRIEPPAHLNAEDEIVGGRFGPDRLNLYTIDEVFADCQVQHLGIASRAAFPQLGELSLVAQPTNIEGQLKAIRLPPPALDEHTGEILERLGYSPEANADFGRLSIVGPPARDRASGAARCAIRS